MALVTKDMTIYEVISNNPDNEKIVEIFTGLGMHCLGCAFARGETVEQAAEVHGVNVDDLVASLNEVI